MINYKSSFIKFNLSIIFSLPLIFISSDTKAELGIYGGIPSFSQNNKVEKMVAKYMCVGIANGKSYPCTIESTLEGIKDSEGLERFEITNLIQNIPDLSACGLVLSAKDTEDLFLYGGHVGDKASGVGGGDLLYPGTEYRRDGSTAGDGIHFVKGPTNTNVATELVYRTPERSGIFTVFTSLTAPDNPLSDRFAWRFPNGNTVNYFLDKNILAIHGLTRLPGCSNGSPVAGQNYTILRGDRNIHPEGAWGREAALRVAITVANRAFRDYNRTISYNDVSHPTGGYSHHKTHRTGKDIDINRFANKYDCNNLVLKDRFIHFAFISLYGLDHLVKGETPLTAQDRANDKNYPNLHCYSDDRMHIDAIQ